MIRDFRLETDGEDVVVFAACRVTKEIHNVRVRKTDWLEYRMGKLAQDAFPYLNHGNREFLISGTSPRGWKQLFGE